MESFNKHGRVYEQLSYWLGIVFNVDGFLVIINESTIIPVLDYR